MSIINLPFLFNHYSSSEPVILGKRRPNFCLSDIEDEFYRKVWVYTGWLTVLGINPVSKHNFVPETQIRVSKEPPEEEMHRIDVEEEEDKPLKLKVKSVARLTFSQIVQLYSKYLEYRKGLEEYGSQHSQRLP